MKLIIAKGTDRSEEMTFTPKSGGDTPLSEVRTFLAGLKKMAAGDSFLRWKDKVETSQLAKIAKQDEASNKLSGTGKLEDDNYTVYLEAAAPAPSKPSPVTP